MSTNSTVVKTTDYVGALVYEGTTDKFLNTEEGRVVLRENGTDKEEYQYHLKDHLGNVRVTFTTADREAMTSTYVLTMEPEFATLEATTFEGLDTRQVDVLYNKTEGGKASARLNAKEGKVMGPSMSLKVMPGDTIKMNVFAKYDKKAKSKDAVTGMAAIVASAFVTEEMAPEAATMVTRALQAPLGTGQTALFAKDHTIPKAYINYLFFDKNMNYKTGGFKQVSQDALGAFEELELDFAPQEEGYLMVYVANQTAELLDVHFDQLLVEHTSGPIVRVDDYYPFGMTFNTGVLAGALTNKYLYNGKELQDELGLDWYDYGARMYDAAVGRWHAPDPLSQFHSPYNYAGNSPVNVIDPSGMWAETPNGWMTSDYDEIATIMNSMRPNENKRGRHTVQEGETAEDIMKKYDLTTAQLNTWNLGGDQYSNLFYKKPLTPGSELIISEEGDIDNWIRGKAVDLSKKDPSIDPNDPVVLEYIRLKLRYDIQPYYDKDLMRSPPNVDGGSTDFDLIINIASTATEKVIIDQLSKKGINPYFTQFLGKAAGKTVGVAGFLLDPSQFGDGTLEGYYQRQNAPLIKKLQRLW